MAPNYTERVQKILGLSRQEAQRLNCEFIGTEHFLLGIIQEGGSVAAKVMKNLNVDLKRVRQEIDKLITPSTSPTVTLGQLPYSPRAKHALELAHEEAYRLGCDIIGSEHILLGVLKENEGIAWQVLTNLGLRIDEVRDMVLEVIGAPAYAAPTEGAGNAVKRDSRVTEGGAWPSIRIETKDEVYIVNVNRIVTASLKGQTLRIVTTLGKPEDLYFEGGPWVLEIWQKLEKLLGTKAVSYDE